VEPAGKHKKTSIAERIYGSAGGGMRDFLFVQGKEFQRAIRRSVDKNIVTKGKEADYRNQRPLTFGEVRQLTSSLEEDPCQKGRLYRTKRKREKIDRATSTSRTGGDRRKWTREAIAK